MFLRSLFHADYFSAFSLIFRAFFRPIFIHYSFKKKLAKLIVELFRIIYIFKFDIIFYFLFYFKWLKFSFSIIKNYEN